MPANQAKIATSAVGTLLCRLHCKMRGLALTSSPILLPLGLIVHGSSEGSPLPSVQHMCLGAFLSACLLVSHTMVVTEHGHPAGTQPSGCIG
jgi:hypothetical protein